MPARPALTPEDPVFCSSARVFASPFFQTSPRDDALGVGYPSPPSGWTGTRTRSCRTCSAHKRNAAPLQRDGVKRSASGGKFLRSTPFSRLMPLPKVIHDSGPRAKSVSSRDVYLWQAHPVLACGMSQSVRTDQNHHPRRSRPSHGPGTLQSAQAASEIHPTLP